jgi:hypothetical protein
LMLDMNLSLRIRRTDPEIVSKLEIENSFPHNQFALLFFKNNCC